ncbi:hypothetical protein [Dielma fastidiosa]|uniref:hypothetical protein n=2 Tax=Dielma fastidiosa TaxID=1034346 RepID=UPI000E49EDB5|nr:hypothetical protein [Dielma fastidiosa]RHN01741.1 hypothetical protein DWZ33_07040 [Dielma fastidiosa]
MNKYSSKAVKTAATVGMSLAMVLSNAAPVFAAAPAVPTLTCTDSDTKDCKDIFYDLSKAIEKIGLDELTMDSEGTINGSEKQNIIATILKYRAGLAKYAEGSDYTTLRKWTDIIDKLIDASGNVAGADNTGMFDETKFLAGTAQANDDKGLVNYYSKMLADASDAGWKDLTTGSAATKQKAAVKAFEKLEKWVEEGYADRLNDDLADRFDTVYNDLEEVTSEYRSSDEDVTNLFVAAWSTVLEQDLNGNKTLDFGKNKVKFEAETGLTEGSDTINLSSKTEIKDRIQAIKDAPNYYRVKNEDAVQDIIDQYNDLLGTITDLKDLLKDDAYKAYLTTKTDDAEATVKSVISGFSYTKTTEKDKAKELAKTLDVEQYEILKAMVEDVLNNAYNFETKKVGNYYVDKSGWVDGFTGSSTITRDLGNSDFLLNLVDTKEGTFGIDVVMNHLADFVEAWDAVTTDIAKLTPANIKASDKATLEAAEDAYYEMSATDGKYVNNLTKDQKKELRKIKTKVENLREAFDNLGVTNVAGWYDMGNGNWGYNNEDGTPAAYKWVASGADWYMIKDGKMLRNTWLATDGGRWYYLDNAGKMVTNQSVDGCWINSYGVYMSPSYNG